MSGCGHEWRKVHEEFLLGGHTHAGWRCRKCEKFVSASEVTPAGIGGTVLNEHELVGPHGGCGNCADGSVYRKQILHEDGRLEVVRP